MDEIDITGLVGLVANTWSLLMAAGIFVVTRALEDADVLTRNPVTRRILPFVPEGLGIAAAFAGGLPAVAGQPAVIKIAAGLCCAYMGENFGKLLGRVILGEHPRGPAARGRPGSLADEDVGAALKSPATGPVPLASEPALVPIYDSRRTYIPPTCDLPSTVVGGSLPLDERETLTAEGNRFPVMRKIIGKIPTRA